MNWLCTQPDPFSFCYSQLNGKEIPTKNDKLKLNRNKCTFELNKILIHFINIQKKNKGRKSEAKKKISSVEMNKHLFYFADCRTVKRETKLFRRNINNVTTKINNTVQIFYLAFICCLHAPPPFTWRAWTVCNPQFFFFPSGLMRKINRAQFYKQSD